MKKQTIIMIALSIMLLTNIPVWAQPVQHHPPAQSTTQMAMPTMTPSQKQDMMADMQKHHQMMMEEGQMMQDMGAMMQRQGKMMMEHAQMMQNCPMMQQMMMSPTTKSNP